MLDDRGGTAVLDASSNGASSHTEARAKFLKIDKPPFELDDLVVRAQARLKSKFNSVGGGTGRPTTGGGGGATGATALERARREVRVAELNAEEAAAAERGSADALEAAQAARDAMLKARTAAQRATDAASNRENIATIASAARDAADAAEDARGSIARARAEAEQADLDAISSSLQTPQGRTTRLAGTLRETAAAAEALAKGSTNSRISAASSTGSTSLPGQLRERLRRGAATAAELAGVFEGVVAQLVDSAKAKATQALSAEQDREHAQRTVDRLEAAAASGDGTNGQSSDGPFTSPADELLKFVGRKGIRSSLLALTALINRNSLSEVERLMLSTPGVYEWALLRLLKEQGSPATDTKGLRLAVVAEINSEPREFFLEALLAEYRESRDLDIFGDQLERLTTTLLGEDGGQFVRLGIGRTAKALDILVEDERREGELPTFVIEFAKKGEIDPVRFTDDVQAAMVDYLENLGLTGLTTQKVTDGEYDEYFIQAYNFALFGDGRRRPAKLRPVRPSDNDFLMDEFALAEEQGVVRDHILASAALYQMYVLGDQLGIFAMPTALMLRRARGRLDLSRGSGSQQLQEYKRYLRTAPLEPEDRQLLYRRVFNEGTGEVLDDAVANEDFPQLWDALMSEVGEYIRKTEENSSDLEDKISRSPVDEAVRNLQYNLSFFATDVAEDVRDMKEQYDLALAVLQNPDIISAVVTGPRQNMWTVIERVIADDIKKTPNVSAMRRLGVEGYKILRYVAGFEGPVSDEDFKNFIRSGEIWIIAQGALGQAKSADEPEEEDEFDDAGATEDDDWES